MESKRDLEKIGLEGFALLEEYYGKKGRQSAPPKPPTPKNSFASQGPQTCLYRYQPQKPIIVYQVNPVSRTEKLVIHNHDAKPDLVKIGLEGFALLDDYYGKKPGPVALQKPPVSSRPSVKQGPPELACYYQYQPEKPHVYQVKPAYAIEERVMNVYEAAKMHGGVLIINRSN